VRKRVSSSCRPKGKLLLDLCSEEREKREGKSEEGSQLPLLPGKRKRAFREGYSLSCRATSLRKARKEEKEDVPSSSLPAARVSGAVLRTVGLVFPRNGRKGGEGVVLQAGRKGEVRASSNLGGKIIFI